MAVAVDPTYPLYPIGNLLAAAMLLLVLLTSFIRQRWNLGVAFLCFWLFFENLTAGVNAMVWADNADIKLYVYCDIVSRVQIITYVVKPMATLIITRRLYLLASLRPVQPHDGRAERRDLAIEWILGLIIPLLVAGPLYYVVEYLRFDVTEGYGCDDAVDDSVLAILLIHSWTIIPPLLSVSIYYPLAVLTFYRQNRDRGRFLQDHRITTLVLDVVGIPSTGPLPFYSGWILLHADWEPTSTSYTELTAFGKSSVAQFYFTEWTSPVLAYVIFALFGLTSEARASYRNLICTVGGWFGWRPYARKGRSSLGAIEFGAPLQGMSLDAEIGRPSSFINPDVLESEQAVQSESVGAHSGRWETEITEGSLGHRDIHDEATV